MREKDELSLWEPYNLQYEYHFVWATKYRYKILKGDLGQQVRDLARQTCEAHGIQD